MERLAYSIPEAAEALGLSRSCIYELMGAGRIRYIKAGRRRIIPAATLAQFLAAAEAAA